MPLIVHVEHLGQAIAVGERLMASLDNLSAALDSLGTDVQQAATDVSAKLAELIAEIQTLTAGSISQDQIDTLAAKATAADDAVKALDAAAQAATV